MSNGLLASATSNVTNYPIQIWNITSKAVIFNMLGHTNNVNVFLELPNNILASGSADSTIKLWDVINGILLNTLTSHTASVNGLVYQNSKMISASDDRSINIWSNV